ncbi:ribbon-helix-helix domain-containing protein [Methylobacterium sp. ap11]|uniref:ribbon-helix-helix domain-containing protein n=1 Tax=Methylobacterium sp. ap11 TaxID=1761799 RepID=UPI001FCDE037|nr:ribbon-helix-helix domain-containing protein [Methylobacterium sp. ap11]
MAGHQHGEFLASEAAGGRRGRADLAQDLRHAADHLVADVVAEAIVDRLEVVDVDLEQLAEDNETVLEALMVEALNDVLLKYQKPPIVERRVGKRGTEDAEED